jgi:hypothetical protein
MIAIAPQQALLMSSVTGPVFPVEVIRFELTTAAAADFAVHYGHMQQLLRERQLEQQWQHLYSSQFLTQQSEQQQQFQQQLQTLRLQQQNTKGSDDQQQPQLQKISAKVPPDVKSGLMWFGDKAAGGASSQPKGSSGNGSIDAPTGATGAGSTATTTSTAAAAAATAAATASDRIASTATAAVAATTAAVKSAATTTGAVTAVSDSDIRAPVAAIQERLLAHKRKFSNSSAQSDVTEVDDL